MEKINSFKKMHPVIFSALIILITQLFFIPVKTLYSLENAENFHCLIRELIVAAFSIALVFSTGQTHIYKCGTKNLLKGLWSGFIIIVLAGLGSSAFIAYGIAEKKEFKSPVEIAAFIVFLLLIGIAEESVCRGIVTDALIERYGRSKGGIWLSVALSGVFFGLFHITNVFSQSVGETIVQMIATSMTGMILSAVYVRHRNIFAPMLLHSIFDFMAMAESGLFAGNYIVETAVAQDFNFSDDLKQALISQSLFVIIALFILRPKIAKRIAENNTNI